MLEMGTSQRDGDRWRSTRPAIEEEKSQGLDGCPKGLPLPAVDPDAMVDQKIE
jgi:hypothetical protein